MDTILKFITSATGKPFLLALLYNLLVYALGAGTARYLGMAIDWNAYTAGQAASISLMAAAFFLHAYFSRLRTAPSNPSSSNSSEFDELRKTLAAWLLACVAFITIATLILMLMLRNGMLPPSSLLLIIAGFLLALACVAPPLRLIYSGAGEVVISFLLSMIIPAFSYSLFAGELHRYLVYSTVPLASFFLSAWIVLQFITYDRDCRECNNNLLVRLGWQKTWHLHNLLIIGSYMVFLAASLQGFPWKLLWPVFLPLPLAVLQVLLLKGVADGRKPQWNLLQMVALILTGLTAYLITYTYWIN